VNQDRFVALPIASQSGDDVFAMEFRNGWEARDARQAAALVAADERPESGDSALARGLVTIGRMRAATLRHLDDVVADKPRRARPIGR
jgi:hypothetical protein